MSLAPDSLECSIIGSFRKHYELALQYIAEFESAGIRVRSPQQSTILQPNIGFVRLRSDPPSASDNEVQLIALHRILSSDFVFVVVQDGYIGPTTAYEIGRIVDRQVPLFFSSRPSDLPLPIPDRSVIDARALAAATHEHINTLDVTFPGVLGELDQDLLSGRFWDEPRLAEVAR
jgi:hypothetical protein